MREKEKGTTATAPERENVSSSGEVAKNFGAESPPVLKGNGKAKRTRRVSPFPPGNEADSSPEFWSIACNVRNMRTYVSHIKTISQQVMFTTPPKYKTKHSISGMMRKNRTALQTLQPNASNPKLLVGSGSPRIATIGKLKKKKVRTVLCV